MSRTVINKVRGMEDMLPQTAYQYEHIINIAKKVSTVYGYKMVYTPMVEHAELFTRSLGESSDVINKEMYNFADKSGRELVLRPEGTASIARSIIENKLDNMNHRLMYYGPMFRYERPQRGRYRQFHQFGVENLHINFDKNSFIVDAEVISLAANILNLLNIKTTLLINNLGNQRVRTNYIKALVEYFSKFKNNLPAIEQNRLINNPLRILDSKDETVRDLMINAPLIEDFYDGESKEYFKNLLSSLDDINVSYRQDSNLVRGLDYYSNTVFEFIAEDRDTREEGLGAQNTVLGGGRYNFLYGLLGGKPLNAIGFALGVERIMLLLNRIELKNSITIATAEETNFKYMLNLVENLRKFVLNVNKKYEVNCLYEVRNLKNILKYASDRSSCMLIFMDLEGKVLLKNLINQEQQIVSQEMLHKDNSLMENFFIKIINTEV